MQILTCSQYKANCSAGRISVEPNPDIAGIGVILSFLVTTCFAFLIASAVMFLDRFPKIATLYRKHIQGNPEPYEENMELAYWRSASFWFTVLSKNLLAFSDTQLVTGLAIQFTAMIQHCTISIYHFQVVVELAFLTTITHLLALVALRNYFVRNKWINLPRICFMLANLGLLGYTSYIAYSYDLAGLHASHDLACFFQGKRPGFKAAFAGRWATLLIGAIGGHVTIMLAMYLFTPWRVRNDQEDDRNKPYSWKWWGAVIRTWIIAPGYSIYGLVMGGRALRGTQALGKASVEINGSEREWGFGQFLPLLLLALPLFAGWESFWEEKDVDSNRWGSRTGRSRNTSRNDLNSFPMANKPHHRHRSRSNDVSDAEAGIESHVPSPLLTPRVQYSPRPSQHSSPSASPSRPSPSPQRNSRSSSRPAHRRQGSSQSFSRPIPPRQGSSPLLNATAYSPSRQESSPSLHPNSSPQQWGSPRL